MIQARGIDPKTNRITIFLGLEEGNIERLRKGQPIHLHADQLGFCGDIVIILGKDVDALKAMLAPGVTPETKIHDRRKAKKQ